MKIGDMITMSFSCFGETSKEKWRVCKFDDNEVTLENDCDEYVFDRKTGRCKNDNAMWGAKRNIKPQ